jgi:DNA-binding response OmpR family regulator
MSVKAAGFAHDCAENGLEALEKFKKTRYDAVVMGRPPSFYPFLCFVQN